MFDSINTEPVQFVLLLTIGVVMGFVLAVWWVGG